LVYCGAAGAGWNGLAYGFMFPNDDFNSTGLAGAGAA
jgi:hypothetical protein